MRLPTTPLIFLSLTALASAVNLRQYVRPNCYGAIRLCSNIGINVCCQSVSRVFASGDCVGCTSTDFHITWTFADRKYCGRSAAVTAGGRCIGGSSNLRGHSRCRLCGTREIGNGTEGEEGRVEGELDGIDGGVEDQDGGGRDGIEERDGEENRGCTSTVEPDLISLDSVTYYRINHDVPKEDSEAIEAWIDGGHLNKREIPEYLKKYETVYVENEEITA